MALGKIGDPRAVEPLEKALRDKGPYVRKAAKAALEKIDDYSRRTIFEINAKAALERICRGIEGKGEGEFLA